MLTRRIIPCLDVKDGRTVKGTNFKNLRDAGDAVELAQNYVTQGADELVFLDITATIEGRGTFLQLVADVATTLSIPFTVGGGVRSVEDASALLQEGADKVAVNSAALKTPDLIDALAKEFGSQCVVVAVDTKKTPEGDTVFVNAGRTETDRRTKEWVREIQERGGGEILLTSMDHDGTKAGFALDIISVVSTSLTIPVIASGGAGCDRDFIDVFEEGRADAALAASIFHFQEVSIPELKRSLARSGVPIRITEEVY